MKPIILTFPDSLRDALLASYTPDITIMNEKEEPCIDGPKAWAWLAPQLFNLHPDPALTPFLSKFQQAFLALNDGSGCPAMMLRNLPEALGEPLMEGLAHGLAGQGRIKHRQTLALHDKDAQTLHHEYNHPKKELATKPIQFIHCAHAVGKQPTCLISADELVAKIAEQENTSVDAIRERLMAIELAPNVPLLRTNPNFEVGTGAVKTILALDYIAVPIVPFGKKAAALKAVERAARECVKDDQAQQVASTESNTLLIMNDALIYHGRGAAKEQINTADKPRELRALMSYPPTWSERHPRPESPFDYTTQSPVSFVERAQQPATGTPDGITRK